MPCPSALEPHPVPILSPFCPHSLAETHIASVSSLSVVERFPDYRLRYGSTLNLKRGQDRAKLSV
jgi:hypothetical protein